MNLNKKLRKPDIGGAKGAKPSRKSDGYGSQKNLGGGRLDKVKGWTPLPLPGHISVYIPETGEG